MTTVLLFGASGFLGEHVRTALAPYANVISPGRAECDLLDIEVGALTELVYAAGADAVVNCTGRLAGSGYDLIRANTIVTSKIIEAVAVGAPAARLVRLGSASEYGPVPLDHAVREDDPAVPVSEYGISHLAATRLVEFACVSKRIDAVVLRVFNPIGPGLTNENALGRAAALLRQAVSEGCDHIVMGPLDSRRDFVDVRDVALAVRAAVQAPTLRQPVLNVGSGRAVKTRHAVRLLAQAAGFSGEIREELSPSTPTRSANIPWICADISLAARVLGWTPTHDLTDSAKATWAGRVDKPRERSATEPHR
jgi:nucleoside-diphosphate-sugar epimerase